MPTFHDLNPGVNRRFAILRFIRSVEDAGYTGMCVNTKWVLQIKEDKDLQHLIRRKLVYRKRQVSFRSGRTYLCLTDKAHQYLNDFERKKCAKS